MSGSQQLLLGGSVQQAVDPYFYSVTSLLHGDGTNGGQNNTFLDSSSNNFTITRNGNTTQGSFSPFSQTGWSNYFDGTGDYLTFPNNTAFAFGTGAFTIEFWVNGPLNNDKFFLSGRAAIGTMHITTGGAGGSTAGALRYVGSSTITSGSAVVTNDTWNHCAIVRDGSNNITLYVNGASVGTGTDTTNYTTTSGTWYIASNDVSAPANTLTAYLSNLRIVKGTAVYTAAFTPPTAPLTAISGTSLLTCQANRFLDASSNAFAITRNGDVSVQPFSPFNPITAYSTSAIGGSGYFDGSGDWLTLPSSSNLAFGTGDFSVEAWVYPTSLAGNGNIISNTTNSDTQFGLLFLNTGLLRLAGWNTAFVSSSAGAITTNQWQHVVACRSGTTASLFVNGTRVGTATVTNNFSSTDAFNVGRNPTPFDYFVGYMSSLRILKGSSAYDATQSTLTIPTAPLTAITNTQALLSYTNAAIFDNAAVSDYETVGNAQISTSVKKYGTGSIYLDGTGDYLVTDAPTTVPMAFGTGDFTIECWVYRSASASFQVIFDFRKDASTDIAPLLYLVSGVPYYYTNAGDRINGGITLSNNTWYHIALCRVASQTKLFVNGTQVGATYADTNNYVGKLGRPTIGAEGVSVGASPFTGYIDDVRISKGIGRYPYNFTPPTAEFPNIGGTVTLTADPYFDYTTLLLPGNGTNGAQNNTFLDSSTNNFTITRNGNTTQGTFSPFSQTGWSNYFDGTGDFLSVANNAALDLGSGDYTIEGWWYFNDTSNQALVSKYTANNGYVVQYQSGNLRMVLGLGASDQVNSFAWTPVANTWYHIAITRSGTSGRAFVNGTQIGTTLTFTTSNTAASATLQIGSTHTVSELTRGYVSNFRLVKGTAVYTANFTPPTTPLTAITNTSLLTCQSNRFIDNSTNAFAITANGDVSVQAFSPFNPTASWSAATNGGSGYFDGSGDYLTLGSNTAFAFPGDFTIECWVYLRATGQQHIYEGRVGTTTNTLLFYINASTQPSVYINGSVVITGSTALTTGQWYHLATSRVSNTLYLFVNGVSAATPVSNSVSIASGTGLYLGINDSASGSALNGYLSGLRVLKGTGYTSISVPTAPPTAIANTSLLTNFTNAGIYDATSKNDLETVGNAQISTTQSKFGGSSMYFDGTDDRLVAPSNVDVAIGTADFTIEGWFYTASPATNRGIFQISTTAGGLEAGNTNNLAVYCSSSVLGVYYASTFKAGTTSISANTWTHFALVRFGGSTKLYVNGIADGGFGTNADTQNYTGKNVCVGGYFSTTYLWSGYIQDFRVTRGIARYTSNFTPPTTAFLTL